MKLSIDQQEYLLDQVQSSGWPYLVQVIDQFVAQYEQDVIRLNIEDGITTRLVHTKLRAEGAKKLAADIKALPNLVKQQVKE